MIDTKQIVWVSRAPMDSTRVKGFTNNLSIADRYHAVDAMQRNNLGEPLPSERFPTEFYVKDPGEKIQKLPDLANAGGFWTVSAAVAEVLRSVDLGRSSLYPVKAFRYDRKTPLEGEYFCLNFGETKSAFLPEQSPQVKGNSYQKVPTNWALSLSPKDGDMAVDESALSGPELWIDPRVRSAFFLSDRLAQALKAAKLARHWGLFRCRVIETAYIRRLWRGKPSLRGLKRDASNRLIAPCRTSGIQPPRGALRGQGAELAPPAPLFVDLPRVFWKHCATLPDGTSFGFDLVAQW